MKLQFLFDSVEVENPNNWDSLTIEYKRDPAIHGLFTIYTNDLEFTGSGYDAIQTALSTTACQVIAVTINYKCNDFDPWDLLFEGEITVDTIEWMPQECTAKVTIEQSSAAAMFFRNVDTPQIWFPHTTGIDCKIMDWANSLRIGWAGNAILPPWNLSSGFIKTPDLLNAVIKASTAGQMQLNSNFFQYDVYTPCQITIEITALPILGESLYIELLTDSGNTLIYEIEYDGIPLNFYAMIERVMLLIDQPPNDFVPALPHERCYDVVQSAPGFPILRRYKMYFRLPTTVVSVTCGSGTATGVVSASYESGAEFIGVFFSEWFAEYSTIDLGGGVFSPGGGAQISFKRLFVMLDRMFNLGMRIIGSPGSWFVQIELLEDLYNAIGSPQLTLENVSNITKKYDQSLIGEAIRLGKPLDTDNITADLPPEAYYSSDRSIIQDVSYTTAVGTAGMPRFRPGIELDTDFDCEKPLDYTVPDDCFPLHGATLVDEIEGTNHIDNAVYFAMVDGTDQFYYETTRVITAGPSRTYNDYLIYGSVDTCYFFHKNKLPAHYVDTVTIRNEWTSGGGININLDSTSLQVAVPEGDFFLPIQWFFERHISFTEWLAIIDSDTIAVNPGTDPLDEVEGYIMSVKYRVLDGLAKFHLAAKS